MNDPKNMTILKFNCLFYGHIKQGTVKIIANPINWDMSKKIILVCMRALTL